MDTKKQARRERAKERLTAQLASGVKTTKEGTQPLTDQDRKRIKKELEVLATDGKKKKPTPGKDGREEKQEKWFIDIYSINYGYIKNSERRKNKGKSRKKMKKVKTMSLVKSVVAQPGMITSYKDGRMGLSPKFHAFKLRKEEPSTF
jgi:hypothetical protein